MEGNRYVGYAEVCADYELCFATDFRDVFFQANPFVAVPSGADLILPEERANITIGGNRFNRAWIQTCWGGAVLNKIGHHQVICSGTIMGTPRGFEELKKKMLSEEEKCAGITGQDQGRLSYLYYSQHSQVCPWWRSHVEKELSLRLGTFKRGIRSTGLPKAGS